MIAAVVLTNQPASELQVFGRLFHFASIAGAVALLLTAIGRWSLPYVAIVGTMFLVGAITLQRLPYEVFLNVMKSGCHAEEARLVTAERLSKSWPNGDARWWKFAYGVR